MQNKNQFAFCYKWLAAVLFGASFFIFGIISLIFQYFEMGAFFSAAGLLILLWFLFFVPYGFYFDKEKIVARYIRRNDILYISGIRCCDLEESGIRSYPWGYYYHIISSKPNWNELKIPKTEQTALLIKRYVKK